MSEKPSHSLKEGNVFFTVSAVIFLLLIVLDISRIPDMRANAHRALADVAVLSICFVYLYVRRPLPGWAVLLVVLVVKFISYTGRHQVLSGPPVPYMMTMEAATLVLFFILNRIDDLIIFGLHPIPVLLSGSTGNIYVVSLMLLRCGWALSAKRQRIAGVLSHFFYGAGAIMSLPAFLITPLVVKGKRRILLTLGITVVGSGLIFFSGHTPPWVLHLTGYFKGETCASLAGEIFGSMGFRYYPAIGALAVLAALVGNSSRSREQDVLPLYLMFAPFMGGGLEGVSLYGFFSQEKSLVYFSFSFLLLLGAGEWPQGLCHPPVPYLIMMFLPLLVVYVISRFPGCFPGPRGKQYDVTFQLEGMCIEKAAKKYLKRMMEEGLEGKSIPESEYEVLREFVETADFRTLRSSYPVLDGSKSVKVKLFQKKQRLYIKVEETDGGVQEIPVLKKKT